MLLHTVKNLTSFWKIWQTKSNGQHVENGRLLSFWGEGGAFQTYFHLTYCWKKERQREKCFNTMWANCEYYFHKVNVMTNDYVSEKCYKTCSVVNALKCGCRFFLRKAIERAVAWTFLNTQEEWLNELGVIRAHVWSGQYVKLESMRWRTNKSSSLSWLIDLMDWLSSHILQSDEQTHTNNTPDINFDFLLLTFGRGGALWKSSCMWSWQKYCSCSSLFFIYLVISSNNTFGGACFSTNYFVIVFICKRPILYSPPSHVQVSWSAIRNIFVLNSWSHWRLCGM